MTDISEVLSASIIRVISSLTAVMVEAVSTSGTLASFYSTAWHNIQGNSDLLTDHYENLKSHQYQL
jgi:hypothetical protein